MPSSAVRMLQGGLFAGKVSWGWPCWVLLRHRRREKKREKLYRESGTLCAARWARLCRTTGRRCPRAALLREIASAHRDGADRCIVSDRRPWRIRSRPQQGPAVQHLDHRAEPWRGRSPQLAASFQARRPASLAHAQWQPWSPGTHLRVPAAHLRRRLPPADALTSCQVTHVPTAKMMLEEVSSSCESPVPPPDSMQTASPAPAPAPPPVQQPADLEPETPVPTDVVQSWVDHPTARSPVSPPVQTVEKQKAGARKPRPRPQPKPRVIPDIRPLYFLEGATGYDCLQHRSSSGLYGGRVFSMRGSDGSNSSSLPSKQKGAGHLRWRETATPDHVALRREATASSLGSHASISSFEPAHFREDISVSPVTPVKKVGSWNALSGIMIICFIVQQEICLDTSEQLFLSETAERQVLPNSKYRRTRTVSSRPGRYSYAVQYLANNYSE